jgi:malate dehydrogenase (oxaloacetate-decarboxylating)
MPLARPRVAATACAATLGAPLDSTAQRRRPGRPLACMPAFSAKPKLSGYMAEGPTRQPDASSASAPVATGDALTSTTGRAGTTAAVAGRASSSGAASGPPSAASGSSATTTEAHEGPPSSAGYGAAQTSYTVTIRVTAAPHRALLFRLGQAASSAGAAVFGMDLVEVSAGGTTVDLTVQAASEEHVASVVAAIEGLGCRVRAVSDRTFLYHLGGKIEVVPRVAVRTRQDLSLAYTPGVGRVASAIARRPGDAWALTSKGTSVAIATDGSAVLGLGALGPLAALPVMEGKALLFKHFGGLNAYPLCLDVRSPQALVEAVAAVAPGFGGINLEDIAAPACFWVEAELQRRLDIPVFHDDQHGTAVVVMAGLLNACRLSGRELTEVRVVLVGVGAAGTAVAEALLRAGVRDLVLFDKEGVLKSGPGALAHHALLAERTNPRGVSSMEEAIAGADVFIGTARRGSVDPTLLAKMASRPIVFALANPEPEVFGEELADDAIIATGRSDLPNQVNNSLCFPGFFKGALSARASAATPAMKDAATRAIAGAVSDDELALGVIVPSMFQPRVHESVAAAVAAAWETGQQGTRNDPVAPAGENLAGKQDFTG